jgi:hypothetical protein
MTPLEARAWQASGLRQLPPNQKATVLQVDLTHFDVKNGKLKRFDIFLEFAIIVKSGG